MLLVDGDPDCRSAGSFFKNPIVTEEMAERVRKIAESCGGPIRDFPADGGRVKIAAAWLIEQAGFAKGYSRLGAAGISSRHTLALVNRGGARRPKRFWRWRKRFERLLKRGLGFGWRWSR